MLVGRGARIKNKLFWGDVDQKRLRTTVLDYEVIRGNKNKNIDCR